jgi:hypothetical protein
MRLDMNKTSKFGVERGVSLPNGKGSDYEITRFDSEDDARAWYETFAGGAPEVPGGYASIVELDASGAPIRTIETTEYVAEVAR